MSIADSRGGRARTFHFFALLAAPLLGLFPYMRWMNNPNEHTRTFTTMALVESGSLDITPQLARYGRVADLAARRDPGSGEIRHYSVKAPLTSWLGVPVYAGFRSVAPHFGLAPPETASTPRAHQDWLEGATWALRFFTVQLPCFLFLIAFERALGRVTDDAVLRLSAVAAVGVGSNFLAYATMFTSHALFACAAFTSFALTTAEREREIDPTSRRPSRALTASLLASACTLLEYHAAPVSLALGSYVLFSFRSLRAWALSALAAATCGAALLTHHALAFGHPLATGHRLQVDPGLAAHHERGFNGVALPELDALAALSFDPGFGAFSTSPFLALGLAAIPLVFRRRDEDAHARVTLGVLFVTMLGLFLISSGVYNWRGGWSVGPRYLGAAPPFFAFAGVFVLERIARRGWRGRIGARGLALGLSAASLVVTGSVALLINTLPESIARPLPQFAAPMWRAGFTPHHVAELAGMDGAWPFYVIAAAAVGAWVVAALDSATTSPRGGGATLGVAAIVGVASVLPALTEAPGGDRGSTEAVALLARRWEPGGRDRIARVSGAIARGESGPCDLLTLSRLERSVGMIDEAEHPARRWSQECGSDDD